MEKEEIKYIGIGILVLLGFIIGFYQGGIYFKPAIQPIQQSIQTIKEVEKCQCIGLTSEDVKLIIRQQFVPAFEFNYMIDGAVGEATLVPLIKKIIYERKFK